MTGDMALASFQSLLLRIKVATKKEVSASTAV